MACRRVIKVGERVVKDIASECYSGIVALKISDKRRSPIIFALRTDRSHPGRETLRFFQREEDIIIDSSYSVCLLNGHNIFTRQCLRGPISI